MQKTENNEGIWPPLYSLKKHPRARHVKLKASFHKGLEIIVPPKFNAKHLPEILETNRKWIEKKLNEFQFLSKPFELPNEIFLAAIQEKWKILYLKTETKKITLIARPTQEIVLLGDTDNQELCRKALLNWVKAQAKKHLPLQLTIQSQKTQLSYNKVSIRNQTTRWGSCSCDKNINLNYKLIFLPPHLMNHILIHELCHTRHLNHSEKFWQLVASFDSDWKENCKAMRVADKYLPLFVV